MLSLLTKYHTGLLAGLRVTLELCAFVWGAGIVAGGLLGLAAAHWHRMLGVLVRGLSFVVAAIPILVILFWFHYPLQAIIGVVVDPFYTAVAALSLVNVLGVAEIVRSAAEGFPRQFVLAAKVSGMGVGATWWHIQLPLVLRQILPAVLALQVGVLHASLFASLISVDEIFRTVQRINAEVYRPVEVYSMLAVLFVVVCLPLNLGVGWLRSRYTRDLSER